MLRSTDGLTEASSSKSTSHLNQLLLKSDPPSGQVIKLILPLKSSKSSQTIKKKKKKTSLTAF